MCVAVCPCRCWFLSSSPSRPSLSMMLVLYKHHAITPSWISTNKTHTNTHTCKQYTNTPPAATKTFFHTRALHPGSAHCLYQADSAQCCTSCCVCVCVSNVVVCAALHPKPTGAASRQNCSVFCWHVLCLCCVTVIFGAMVLQQVGGLTRARTGAGCWTQCRLVSLRTIARTTAWLP